MTPFPPVAAISPVTEKVTCREVEGGEWGGGGAVAGSARHMPLTAG